MSAAKLILDHVYDREALHPDRVYLSQPVGGGRVIDYRWRQVLDEARRMATHLHRSGLGQGCQVAILSKNCAHFFMAELAIWMAGCTTVAIFPTESPEVVRFVLDHSEARLLFVGKLDSWEQQAAGVPADLPRITLPLAPATRGESWQRIIDATPPIAGRPQRAADDLAMLIYTSGSTGEPKGVMHRFGPITRAAEGFAAALGYREDDRYLSYLPLAHVIERALVLCTSLIQGGHIFFAESLDSFLADIKRARPTVFASVPRLWLKFQQGVFAKIPAGRLELLLTLPIVGRRVGRKVLAELGLDQVRLAGSGSAPVPAELLAWYRRLGLNLMEGYGMTEDFAYSHVSTREHCQPGTVGVPYPGVEARLSEDHEILIKSPGLFTGYFKRPDLTAACMTDDGFFRTGDLGERCADGALKITGRLKELFKTAKGKYVAPAPIENRLNAHPLIELSVVTGVGQSDAFGLVMLAEDQRGQTSDPKARARIESELGQLLQRVNQDLSHYERLRMLVIAPEAWTIENGCLTPTMKIRRARIEAQISDRLDAWYGERRSVLWG